MEPEQPRRRGRPKKQDTEGTAEQVKKRLYMRNYVNGIKKGIVQLEKDELKCLKELERMRIEKSNLINMLDEANTQAENILTERTRMPVKKMARPMSISVPKPAPKVVVKVPPPIANPANYNKKSSDILMTYLKDEGARTLQGAVRRKMANK